MIYQDDLDFAALRLYARALNDRAKENMASGRLSAIDLRDRILESGGRCEWCERNLVGAEFELDHVISLSQRGANAPANLAVACPDCNRRKADKHPARYAVEIYSETGKRTKLIARIVAHYELETSRQLSLFADEGEDTQPEPNANEPPPYRWTD